MKYTHTIQDGWCTVCQESLEWLKETGQTNFEILEPQPTPDSEAPQEEEDH